VTALLRGARLLLFDGQSLPLGPSTALAYPARTVAALSGTFGQVEAVSNTTWLQRSTRAARRVDRHLRRTTGRKVLVDCGGTSNINNGENAAAILAEAEAYWTARRTAGWDLIVATDVPDSIGFQPDEETQRAALNAALATSSLVDVFVPIAATLGDPTGPNFTDGTHLAAPGAQAIADLLAAALGP
jgi:lysophospholipase L1-like esterase